MRRLTDTRGIMLLVLAGILLPFLFPAYMTQLTVFWIFVILALTWDMQGGQMGYNSFGNIFYFGLGMYTCASIQVGLFVDLAQWNASGGEHSLLLTLRQYAVGLVAGILISGLVGAAAALFWGYFILRLRGHYFAICTLGLGVAAGEIASGIDLLGAGSGMSLPIWPDEAGHIGRRNVIFYFIALGLASLCLLFFRFVYGKRFGLALNAIRDDEDKTEAMGVYTTWVKTLSWMFSGFFLALAGGLMGNLIGFIDPTEVAFAGATYGVWMILMAILGGKGSLWGPVLGAVIFHFFQEFFWIYFLGGQRIALGLLIIFIVVFFPRGIMGWLKERFPHWFGIVLAEEESRK